MNDIVFYPVALLAALAIIAAAALPGRDRLDCGSVSGAGTDYQTIRVTGDNLCRFEAAGQSDIEFVRQDDTIQTLIISAASGMLSDRPERNPHFRLAADLETRFAGSEIRITVEARPARDSGASSFEMNYSAGNEGNSDWRMFDLGHDFQIYSFTWGVPLRTGDDQAIDYLAIRPIVPEKTRAVEIRSVVFEVLGLTEEAQAAQG